MKSLRKLVSSVGNAAHRLFELFKLNEPRTHSAAMILLYTAFGFALIFQPQRFANTPSYANLLALLPQQLWGGIYLLSSFLMALSIWKYTNRKIVTSATVFSFALTIAWLGAFVYRWLTDGGTTIVNVGSWSIFLYLIVRSAMMVDDHIAKSGE